MRVYCFLELDEAGVADASIRALAFARELADSLVSGAGTRVAAVLFGEPPQENLAPYGVTDIIAVAGIDGYAPQAWARALAGLLNGAVPGGMVPDGSAPGGAGPGEPAGVVAAATDRGNEVLAHLGAITGLPMAANCVAASPAVDGGYALVRQRWAGLLLEEALVDGPVALLTVATDVVPARTAGAAQEVSAEARVVAASAPTAGTSAPAVAGSGCPAPVVHRISPSAEAADVVVRAVETLSGAGGASLATARVVVGGGRGVGSAEGFGPLEELAALLGGVVGVSRVVTSEGWRPHSMQVGQTGTKITPDLYLACGISGAIQHIAGCSGARHLIAINKDPSAPMMTRADYAVIGDLHEIVPALVAVLRQRSG